MIKLSDYVVRLLEQHTGSNHAFLLSGGGMMHLLESLGHSKIIMPVPTHHEQAAAIAADAYARTRNSIGICMVTTGPGGTNALTGVAGAFMDSTPVIFISGQVSRANSRDGLDIRQKGIQEVELVPIVQSVTKYAVCVNDPQTIRFHLEKALFLARNGRPGPVWIDIPLDVQAAMIDASKLVSFTPDSKEVTVNRHPSSAQLDAVIEAIERAKRPLLVLGGGVQTASARRQAQELVKALGIPVQTSWNGMDLVVEEHPLFVGRANTFAPRYANLVIQNCDLLLSIGARLGMQHTGYNVNAFARAAYKIMVDLDESEIRKPGLNVNLGLAVDAKAFMEDLTRVALARGTAEKMSAITDSWLGYARKVKSKFPPTPQLDEVADEPFVNPKFFATELSNAIGDRVCAVPIGSSGMGHTIVTGLFPVREGQRVFTSKGLAAMGYGLPSTVGASFAIDKGLTITVVGEGGFQLNIQELQTIAHHHLPVKIFVWNNGGYHSIRMTQKGYFKGHFVASSEGSGVTFPDLQKIATAYGFPYAKIERNNNLSSQLKNIIAHAGPFICEVMIDPEKPLEPKLASYQQSDGTMASRPLEDMAPLLERSELEQYMFIPLIS